jgi:hypothetical protein
LESDRLYYRRRAQEELAAAARAVTPAARQRREALARSFIARLAAAEPPGAMEAAGTAACETWACRDGARAEALLA